METQHEADEKMRLLPMGTSVLRCARTQCTMTEGCSHIFSADNFSYNDMESGKTMSGCINAKMVTDRPG